MDDESKEKFVLQDEFEQRRQKNEKTMTTPEEPEDLWQKVKRFSNVTGLFLLSGTVYFVKLGLEKVGLLLLLLF
jgi:hypothetical protein